MLSTPRFCLQCNGHLLINPATNLRPVETFYCGECGLPQEANEELAGLMAPRNRITEMVPAMAGDSDFIDDVSKIASEILKDKLAEENRAKAHGLGLDHATKSVEDALDGKKPKGKK